jgi:HAD superfamily hydrolase (TIGR01549 family)
MYKAVFLDIGGVVLEIDWKRPFEFAGIIDERRRAELIKKFQGSELFRMFERGEVSAKDFLSGFNALMGVEHPNSFWEIAWHRLIVGELEGAHKIFDVLKGRVPVYGLSNTNVLHYQYMMAAFPILKRFDKVVASNVLGARKPDAEFFLKACTQLKLGPSEVLFVDDTPENIEGARRFGIKAELSVNSVRETVEFLRRHLSLPGDAGA